MTISTTDSRVAYTGDGTTTAFAVPFYFLADADLDVYKNGAIRTITTHYTVSGAGDEAGGTVTFVTAPAVDDEIIIVRDVAITQETDYPANDPFPSASHERALDKLTMIAQRHQDILDRAMVLADSDTSGADMTLPTPSAGKAIIWNDTADGLENGPSAADITAAQTYATQAAASAAAAASTLDEFEDTYLGVKTVDPTTDNDGDPLQTGSLYFNSTSGVLKVYNGVTWDDAVTGTPVALTSQEFSGDGAETTFTLSAAPSSVEYLEVFVSGERKRPTTDYTVSGTTLTFGTAPALGTDNILARWVSAITAYTPNDNTVSTAKLQDGAVTYAKMQDVSTTSRALGRKTAGAGDVEEMTLSELLDFIGSAAQGDILYRGAASWARLGAGTPGQYLKTQGPGANPVWATVSAGGAWEFVETWTATATTSHDFDLQEDIYCEWKFVIDGVIPNTDGVFLLMRPGYSGGTVFDSSNGFAGYQFGSIRAGTWKWAINGYTVIGAIGQGSVYPERGVGTAANEHAHAVITIGGLGSALPGGFVYESKCGFIDTSNDAAQDVITGGYTGTAERTWDSVRFLWSSGNFEAGGTITMFGLKRTG